VIVDRFMGNGFLHHIHGRLATFFHFTRRGHLLSSRDIVEGRYKVWLSFGNFVCLFVCLLFIS
jgi:hypothetical protein